MGLISRVSSRTYRYTWPKKRFTVTQFSRKGIRNSEGINLIDSCASPRAGGNPKVSITAPGGVIPEPWLCQASVLEPMLRPGTVAETNLDLESFWSIILMN